MSSKAYRATRVNDVNWEQIARGKEGLGVTLGIDVGKFDLLVVCRWADGRFERPWRVKNPWEIPTLVALVRQVKADRKLVVAMESSGTYGDALRQALGDNGIEVQRVSGKAAHDYAEVFDGVPSQHDGKDAAVVAELAALGKAKPWAYQAADSWEEELTYWVEEMVAQRQMLTPWQGRLEGLLARHWPEASQVLETLLRDVASDLEALWESPGVGRGRGRRDSSWPAGVVRCCRRRRSRSCWPVRGRVWVFASGPWQQRQIQEYAEQALAARQQAESSATAVASVGRGACGPPGARQGGGCADGVCLVGEHG